MLRPYRGNIFLGNLLNCQMLCPYIFYIPHPSLSPIFPMKLLRIIFALLVAFVVTIAPMSPAWAFCGFYVAKADTKLYNKASQVAIARQGDRTVLTMANDYQGNVKDFALVIPVPVVLKKEQVKVGDPGILERLDAFSAPRLVEYFDENPCNSYTRSEDSAQVPRAAAPARGVGRANEQRLGVTIEARFTVGEYDILILSAKESDGLQTWLTQNGYKIPNGAKELLQPYIKQKMKFFVAKVNLTEFEKTGFQSLRPLMMAFESRKFMLPIRLGMVNAQSEQDLIVYMLTSEGQVELANYRTVKVPSDVEIPVYVKSEFGEFYKSMFKTAYDRADRRVAFMEYAWDMSSCDPCSAEPLTPAELKKAGVFWLDQPASSSPGFRRRPPQNNGVFITRLHVRYTRDKFPEDLVFQQTSNRGQFQGRYVLRHPFKGEATCQAGEQYRRELPKRLEREAQTLAKLTGWNIQDIRKKTDIGQTGTTPWWRSVFP